MLNEKVKDALQKSKTWILATAGETPDAVIIAFHELDAQDNLVFYQVFMNKTIENVKAGSSAAVVVNVEGTMEAYQIKGTATYTEAPEIVQRGNEKAQAMNLTVKGAVIVKPTEVYILTPGPDVGKRI